MTDKAPKIVQNADARTIKEWYDRNEILLVDVREVSEFEKEHIPGALLLPLSTFEPDLFPNLAGKKVVLHCAVGKRSEAAGKMLLNEGHPGAIHLTGGLEAWKAAGYATEVQFIAPELPKKAPEPVFLCPTPGDVLKDEYLGPLGISEVVLATEIGMPEKTVSGLLTGEVTIDVEFSLRLARYFSTAADFWLQVQIEHDLERTRYKIGNELRKEITPRTARI